jgi:hypothetical protein
MKTNFLKTSLSIAIFAFAILGALASQKVSSTALLPETGWVDTPAPCQVGVQCSDVTQPFVCTMIHEGQLKQAYGKDQPSDLTCAKILFRVE